MCRKEGKDLKGSKRGEKGERDDHSGDRTVRKEGKREKSFQGLRIPPQAHVPRHVYRCSQRAREFITSSAAISNQLSPILDE